MKYIFYFFLTLFFLYGCNPSLIKLDAKKNSSSYQMFGKTGSREFFLPMIISDSVSFKWEAEINGSFPNSSVTVYDKFIFVNDLSGRIYCFDAVNGKVAGLLRYGGAVYTTPVINLGNIIFAVSQDDENRSYLYYYNYLTGAAVKEIEIPGRIITELIKTTKEIIFNTENGKVFSYSLTGEKLWEHDTNTFTHSSPAEKDNIIVFGNDKGEITGINAEKGTLVYKEKIGESFFGGAAIDSNTVYIGNDSGNLYALDLLTGKVKWQYETGSRIIMVPVFNDTFVFTGNLKGELYSIKKESGKLNWRINTKGVLNASPLITQNLIIQPDLNESLHFIDINTGEIVNTLKLEGRGKLSPVIFEDVLYIGYDKGILRAYEFVN